MGYKLLKHAVYYSFFFSPLDILDLVITPVLWVFKQRLLFEVSWDYQWFFWHVVMYVLSAMWLVLPAEAVARKYTRYCRESRTN